MNNFITLDAAWTTSWGFTFPAGTVFFRGPFGGNPLTRYDYNTPTGSEGYINLEPDQTPGD